MCIYREWQCEWTAEISYEGGNQRFRKKNQEMMSRKRVSVEYRHADMRYLHGND